jgi:hypothetical protein
VCTIKKLLFITVVSIAITVLSVLSPTSNSKAEAASDPLYNLIYEGIISQKPTIPLGRYGTTSQKISTTYQKVLNDHPEIFYLNNSYKYSVGTNGYFYPNYSHKKAQIASMKKALDLKIASISSKTKIMKSELDRVLYIHDYLINSTTYDYENYVKGSIPQSSYSAYEALIGKKAVCDGYAKAMKLLLNKSGIWAVKVNGYGKSELHAWNMAKVNGLYYYIDATWNDPVSEDMHPVLSYKYFLVPESQLSYDHSWDKSSLPKATSTKFRTMYSAKDFVRSGSYLYYSNEKDNRKLYRMSLTGTGNKKISNTRMYSLEMLNGSLYFSNLSDANRLYKMKLDGTGLKKVKSVPSYGLFASGGYLHYINQNTNKIEKLKVI